MWRATLIISAVTVISMVAFIIDLFNESFDLGKIGGYTPMIAVAILAVLGFAGRRWVLGIIAAIGAIGFVLWAFFVAPAEIPLGKAGMAVFGSVISGIIGLFPGRSPTGGRPGRPGGNPEGS